MSCKHPALFKSMCVTCGMIIRSDEISSLNNVSSLTMHGGAALQVTSQEAEAIQANKLSKMRELKKIALVLDLDHTLLHAVQIDGPCGSSDRKEFPEEVHHLPIEEMVNNKIKHLVMKKRPHLDWFLNEASGICQMTIYTAGTRRYAEAVAKIIDPDHKYFSNRIVSRSDNPNQKVEAHDKSLERIFLKDSSMAVIIDDREDVWRANNDLSQLLLVRPYIYFTPLNTNSSVVEANNSSGPVNSNVMLNNGNVNLRAVSPVIALSGRPGSILKTVQQYSSEFSESDDQLIRCIEIVREIHSRYYSGSDGKNLNDASKNGSADGLKDVSVPSIEPNSTYVNHNNVCDILTGMKSSVLAGCTITFSGIIPTNELNPQNNILYKLAEALGAQVSLDLLPRTTHLISLNLSTTKAIECIQNRTHNIWIVHPDWLIYCRWALARVLEVTFMLNALSPGSSFPQVEMNYMPLTPTTSRRPTERSKDRLSNSSLVDIKPRASSLVDLTGESSSNALSNESNSKRKSSTDTLVATDPRLAKRQRSTESLLSTSSSSSQHNTSSSNSSNSSNRIVIIPNNVGSEDDDRDYDFNEIEDDDLNDGVDEVFSGEALEFHHSKMLQLPSETEGWIPSDVDEEVDGESGDDDDDYSEFESIIVQTARRSPEV